MSQAAADTSGMGTYHDSLKMAQRYAHQHEAYWASSICTIEGASSSVISGLEFPIVGGMVEQALEHAIATAIEMMCHPDDDLHRDADVAIALRGRFLAVIRRTPGAPEVTRFETPSLPPVERVPPGRRPWRRPCLCFLDGSLESTCHGLGTPIEGREPADALEQAIRSFCESTGRPDTVNPAPDDVAFSFRGRILAVMRFTAAGPAITKFDRPGPSVAPATGAAIDDARSTPSDRSRRRRRAEPEIADGPANRRPGRAPR